MPDTVGKEKVSPKLREKKKQMCKYSQSITFDLLNELLKLLFFNFHYIKKL